MERAGRVLGDGEVGRLEVVEVPDDQVVVLAGLARLVLAEGDEVAIVELEVRATEGDAVVEGEDVEATPGFGGTP